MISVPGTIKIRSVEGRFGSFNVATLDCSIGSFTVKDASIEEFDQGVYTGDFVIEKIKPQSYISNGRMVVEVRAILSAIMLSRDSVHQPCDEFESLEQDPMEAEAGVDEGPEPELTPAPDEVEVEVVDDELDEAARLFGILWPLGNVIKLDPTINRALFRQQKDYLKNAGFRFVAADQHWLR